MSRRVVVIDDEHQVRELMGKVLARAGYAVRLADTGEAGLALLEQEPADCLVVDKLLPRMNGLEVLAQVRRRWPQTALVLVTAHPEPFTLDAERPELVLPKPFKSLAAIEEAVAEALEVRAAGPLTQLKDRVVAAVAEITPTRRRRE